MQAEPYRDPPRLSLGQRIQLDRLALRDPRAVVTNVGRRGVEVRLGSGEVATVNRDGELVPTPGRQA